VSEGAGQLAHRHRVTVQWGDCDPAGIVYYPRYLAMFDDSTMALFRNRLGMAKSEMLQHYGIAGLPMVDTRASFLVPSRYGDVVEVESEVMAIGRSRFEIRHRLFREGQVLAAEGMDKRVWVSRDPENPERIRSRPIPADVVARFGLVPLDPA
jgi:4-hydroxybenzoyl-CoA thioesterase